MLCTTQTTFVYTHQNKDSKIPAKNSLKPQTEVFEEESFEFR